MSTDASPMSIDRASVERMLQAIRWAAITGSTISAAIRRIPTILIEMPIVSAASTRRDVHQSDPHAGDARCPRDRAPRRGGRGSSSAIVASPPTPRTSTTPESLQRHGEDRAEEELEEVHVEPAGARDENDPERDARVEDERECLVAAGAAAAAQPLDRERADDGERKRRQDRARRRAGIRGDAGERDVAEPVADERRLPLDEEEADRRGEQADDRADGKARSA